MSSDKTTECTDIAESTSSESKILSEVMEISSGNEEQMNIIRRATSAFGMMSSVPMLCRGERCVYAEMCPLVQSGVDPKTESGRCSLETELVKNMFYAYCIEMEVNPDVHKVQAGLIKDLISIEVQGMRADKILSYGNFITQVVDSVNPNTGEVYYKDELSVVVNMSERLLNQKLKVLDALAATPMAKIKLTGAKGDGALIDKIASFRNQLQELDPPEEEEVYDVSTWEEF